MASPYLTGSVTESAVGLVLTESAGRCNAMTISFFSEVAHHPTSLWISVAKTSYTHELIEESRRFTLATLHEGQRSIAEACGAVSGRDRDKCQGLALHRTGDGFLFLDDALASAACQVTSATDLGDHTLYIANILHGETTNMASFRRHLLTADWRG